MTALRSCAMDLAPTRDTLANVVANCPAEPVYDDFAQCQLSLECTDWAALCGGTSPTSFPSADQSAAQRAERIHDFLANLKGWDAVSAPTQAQLASSRRSKPHTVRSSAADTQSSPLPNRYLRPIARD